MFSLRLTCLLLILTSFSVFTLGQKRPKVDFEKKIAEATPAALPQQPVPSRPSTDARDRNLKGIVRTVTESSLEGKELFEGGPDTYDIKGNLISSVDYDAHYPRSVTVWGYIDDKRVSNTRDVIYAPGEKPMPKGMELMQTLGDPDTPGDKRYDVRMYTEYDTIGRLISKTTYGNNDSIFSRVTYTYNKNERDVRDHDSEGNEISRTVEILDKDGNVIEKRGYGAKGISSIRFMTYEFDSQANWTVQKTFEAKGKTGRKLLWISIRTINYYP